MDYDKVVNEYNKYGKEAITDWVLGYENVLKLLGPIRGKKILDYGSGTGKFSRVLKDGGAEVVGVDISTPILDLAKKNNPDIIFYKDDDNKLNQLDNSFDSAVLNFVLCNVPTKEGIALVLRKIRKALKDDGVLVILSSNVEKGRGKEFMTFSIGDVDNPTSGSKIKIYLGRDKSLAVDNYYWTLEDYKELLSNEGFEVEDTVEPTANNNDYPWINEDKFPPFLIIKSKKAVELKDEL